MSIESFFLFILDQFLLHLWFVVGVDCAIVVFHLFTRCCRMRDSICYDGRRCLVCLSVFFKAFMFNTILFILQPIKLSSGDSSLDFV